MENGETKGSGEFDRPRESAELRFADDEAVGVREADAPACEDGTVAGARAPGPLLPWLPSIPLFFLGLGVYRAWIEIVFVGSFVRFPAASVAGHDAFDLVMIATMFLCAALAKRIGPLFGKRSLYAVSGVALTVSTLCMFASIWIPRSADALAVPAVLLGGFGIALVILLWSELYGCLNPFRVALYYSASMIVAALLIYLCRGLLLPWLGAVVLVLPVVSLAACAAGFRSLPSGELPRAKPSKFSFPWKIVLLMAIYAFAYGLKESSMYQSTLGPHSAFGTLAVAAIVFVGVIARGGKFDFGVIYRIALPLMVAAFLILPNVGVLGQAASDFCTSASYTAFSILIMLIMANLCYRYGMSAVWLFGIERGVRALFTLFGRQTEQLLGAPSFGLAGSDAVVSGLVVILVVAATMILFSEKELSSRARMARRATGPSSRSKSWRTDARSWRVRTACRRARKRCCCCWRSARPWDPSSASCSLRTARPKRTSAISTASSTSIRATSCPICWDYLNNLTNKCSYHMLYCSRTKEPVQALNPTPPEGRAAH